jgi:hypothetical protein
MIFPKIRCFLLIIGLLFGGLSSARSQDIVTPESAERYALIKNISFSGEAYGPTGNKERITISLSFDINKYSKSYISSANVIWNNRKKFSWRNSYSENECLLFSDYSGNYELKFDKLNKNGKFIFYFPVNYDLFCNRNDISSSKILDKSSSLLVIYYDNKIRSYSMRLIDRVN